MSDEDAEQAAWKECLRNGVKETQDLFALGFHAALRYERARRVMTDEDDIKAERAAAERYGTVTADFGNGFLAGLAHARMKHAELSDRVVTIAYEATGPHPVQSADDACTCIEQALYEQRRQIAALELEAVEHSAPIEPEPERKGDEVETPQHLVATLNDYSPSELVGHITERDAAVRKAALQDAADVCSAMCAHPMTSSTNAGLLMEAQHRILTLIRRKL